MRAHRGGREFLLVFDKGEELVSTLTSFAEKEKVSSAFFNGLGAVDRIKVGVYSEHLQSYLYTEYRIHLEISSLTGNIFQFEGKPFVHAHGVFSGNGGMSFGGHIAEAIVSPTCEIHLSMMEIKARRTGSLPLPRITE